MKDNVLVVRDPGHTKKNFLKDLRDMIGSGKYQQFAKCQVVHAVRARESQHDIYIQMPLIFITAAWYMVKNQYLYINLIKKEFYFVLSCKWYS